MLTDLACRKKNKKGAPSAQDTCTPHKPPLYENDKDNTRLLRSQNVLDNQGANTTTPRCYFFAHEYKHFTVNMDDFTRSLHTEVAPLIEKHAGSVDTLIAIVQAFDACSHIFTLNLLPEGVRYRKLKTYDTRTMFDTNSLMKCDVHWTYDTPCTSIRTTALLHNVLDMMTRLTFAQKPLKKPTLNVCINNGTLMLYMRATCNEQTVYKETCIVGDTTALLAHVRDSKERFAPQSDESITNTPICGMILPILFLNRVAKQVCGSALFIANTVEHGETVAECAVILPASRSFVPRPRDSSSLSLHRWVLMRKFTDEVAWR